MSKRNAKKPISKKTASLLDQLKRRSGVRELTKRFLIVCEDSKSAPNYFNCLKRSKGLSATKVVVFGSDGNTQPIQVVRTATARKKLAARADSGTVSFDEAWCVIDGDYGTKINNARAAANANGIQLAISTKCFEYWILLHFEESSSPTPSCDEIVSLLKERHLPNYTKGACDFDDIVQHVEEACTRAERLRKPELNPEDQNPCSEVYRLINAILKSHVEPNGKG